MGRRIYSQSFVDEIRDDTRQAEKRADRLKAENDGLREQIKSLKETIAMLTTGGSRR
jgi:cell division protein FtsB